MNSKISAAPIAACIALALSACTPAVEDVAVATKSTPYSGCSIGETGHQPGQTSDPGRKVVKSLTITCDGSSTDISGDFTNRTSNAYSADKRLRTVIVVNGEARIWHSLKSGDRECLTIQRLDEVLPSTDSCDPQQTQERTDSAPVEA